jgi:hypothetical protein
MSLLDTANFDEDSKNNIAMLWNFIADRKMKNHIKNQNFDETFQKLLSVIDRFHQENIVNYFCDKIQTFLEFNGDNYYTSLKSLEDFLLANKIDIPIRLNDLEKPPEIFIDYVYKAESDYLKYKLSVSPELLDDYFVSLMPDKLENTKIVILEYIDTQETYKLKKFTASIEKAIEDEQINEKNIGDILFSYKNISHIKPLPTQLNDTQRKTLWSSLSQDRNLKGFYDLSAMQISKGVNISNNLNGKGLTAIAECMDYYSDYGELLVYSLSVNSPSLNQVLKYMTENKLGYTLSFDKILPQFFEIIKKINVSANVFLNQLNDWENHKNDITKENIQELIPDGEFFKHSVETKNNLTNHINKTIVESLSPIEESVLYQQRTNIESDYWFLVVKYLLGTEFMPQLPENIANFGIKMLNDIASRECAIPKSDSILQKIIDNLDKKKTAAQIKDIRDKFCKSDYEINPELFIYFEKWFIEQGDLKGENADRVTHLIIQPVFNDDACFDSIISNPDYYAEIINNAGDDATELEDLIRSKLKDNDNRLISFAKRIGITVQKETDINENIVP